MPPETRYARSGSSYLSQSDRRLLFGLGDASQADSIEIRWPDGAVETRGPARSNETLVITQGEAAPPAPRKQ